MSRADRAEYHAIRFDDRAIGVVLEPDAGYECETFAKHAQSLGCAVAEAAGAARVVAELTRDDPLNAQRLHGLLVCIEVLGSMIEAITFDIAEDERIERQSKGKKTP